LDDALARTESSRSSVHQRRPFGHGSRATRVTQNRTRQLQAEQGSCDASFVYRRKEGVVSFLDDFDGLDENSNERIRPEIKNLIARGEITVAELEELRCNSWEWQALVPALSDEALVKQMQHALDNCFTTHRRPFSTYNEAVEGLYAPELIRRFRDGSRLEFSKLVQACKNIGFDIRCGRCAEVFFTGFTKSGHDDTCETSGRKRSSIVSGMKHSYEVTQELYMLALATATGAAAGKENAVCFVQEQGGACIPCVVVMWDHNRVLDGGVAFLVGEMLSFLNLPLPHRGEKT